MLRSLCALLLTCTTVHAGWQRPTAADPRPLWGLDGGIRLAIAPASVEGDDPGGPRGLIRVGYPATADGRNVLMNFIAIEPVTEFWHRRGKSELEPGADGQPGKRLGADPGVLAPPPARSSFRSPATRSTPPPCTRSLITPTRGTTPAGP